MYFLGERNDKGIKVTSVTFYDDINTILQKLHIDYINFCAQVTKYNNEYKSSRNYTFRDWLEQYNRYYICECVPGKKAENLCKFTKPKICVLAEEHGYKLDD